MLAWVKEYRASSISRQLQAPTFSYFMDPLIQGSQDVIYILRSIYTSASMMSYSPESNLPLQLKSANSLRSFCHKQNISREPILLTAVMLPLVVTVTALFRRIVRKFWRCMSGIAKVLYRRFTSAQVLCVATALIWRKSISSIRKIRELVSIFAGYHWAVHFHYNLLFNFLTGKHWC